MVGTAAVALVVVLEGAAEALEACRGTEGDRWGVGCFSRESDDKDCLVKTCPCMGLATEAAAG